MDLPDFLLLVRECVVDRLPALIGQLEGARAAAWARLNTADRASARPSEAADSLLDMPAVAGILGIPEDRAYDLGRQGRLPVVHVGRYVRVRRSVLARFISENEQKVLDVGFHAVFTSARDRKGRGPRQAPAPHDPGGIRTPGRGSQLHG